jgi:hypothetical protein
MPEWGWDGRTMSPEWRVDCVIEQGNEGSGVRLTVCHCGEKGRSLKWTVQVLRQYTAMARATPALKVDEPRRQGESRGAGWMPVASSGCTVLKTWQTEQRSPAPRTARHAHRPQVEGSPREENMEVWEVPGSKFSLQRDLPPQSCIEILSPTLSVIGFFALIDTQGIGLDRSTSRIWNSGRHECWDEKRDKQGRTDLKREFALSWEFDLIFYHIVCETDLLARSLRLLLSDVVLYFFYLLLDVLPSFINIRHFSIL